MSYSVSSKEQFCSPQINFFTATAANLMLPPRCDPVYPVQTSPRRGAQLHWRRGNVDKDKEERSWPGGGQPQQHKGGNVLSRLITTTDHMIEKPAVQDLQIVWKKRRKRQHIFCTLFSKWENFSFEKHTVSYNYTIKMKYLILYASAQK